MIAIIKLTIESLDYIIETCKGIKKELNLEEIKENFTNSFILKQSDEILGFGYYVESNNKGFLKDVIIFSTDDKEKNIYADMIIRSILNAAERKLLEEMIIEGPEHRELLEKIGFTSSNDNMTLDLRNFFSMKCSCSKS